MIEMRSTEIEQDGELSFQPRVIRGGGGPDFERFAGALAMLEEYVDGMLAATELPAMDSWVEDEVMDARLTSL